MSKLTKKQEQNKKSALKQANEHMKAIKVYVDDLQDAVAKELEFACVAAYTLEHFLSEHWYEDSKQLFKDDTGIDPETGEKLSDELSGRLKLVINKDRDDTQSD